MKRKIILTVTFFGLFTSLPKTAMAVLFPPCLIENQLPTALGCISANSVNGVVSWLLIRAIGIGGGLAFLLMLFGAFKVITSSGDPKGVAAGSELITSALGGLLLIIFSLFLLKLVGVDILQIPNFVK